MACDLSAPLMIRGEVEIKRKYLDGRVEVVDRKGNIIINTGLGQMLDLLGGISTRYADSFAWGSGAGSAFVKTDTALHAQTGSKLVGYVNRTGSSITFANTISYTEGNSPGIINEYMLFSSGTSPINLACVYFANQNKTSDFELEIDHTIVLYNSGT